MKQYVRSNWPQLAVVVAILAFGLLGGGYADPAIAVAGIGMLPFVIGDTEEVTAVMKAVNEFKEANDLRLKEIEKKGYASAEVKEKVEKASAAIDKFELKLEERETEAKAIKARADAMEATIKRLNALGLENGGVAKVEAKHMEMYRAMYGPEAGVEGYLEHRKAFNSFMRKGHTEAIDVIQAKAMSVDDNAAGGYWVLPDTSGRTVAKVFESSPVRQVAAVQGISTDALEGSYDLDEPGSGWVAERGSRPETTTPEVGMWRIPTHEMYAEPRATQKLLDDSQVNVETWLGDKVAQKFARDEANAFVLGNGVGKPRGFLTYPAGTPSLATWQVIEQTDTGADGGFIAAPNSGDVFITVEGTMKDFYLGGAAWAMNRTTRAAVRKLKDSNGQYILIMDFSTAGAASILGKPVLAFEDMPALATNSLSIALANWSQAYQIVDRIGIRVLRDPYTAKPFILFYTTRRVGGDVLGFEAIKLMKFAA